ncbi:hypothetical protein SMC26_40220 [Actinomadura fulvescens]|uniref:Uncharacterized protein n=1 Tax=Actinomadura fulvescens TaxID=46160 RepID=A0ABN3Q6H8_9ACTN
MTTATMNRPAVWWSEDITPAQVVQIIKEAFPRVRAVYFGEATRQWWALVGRAGVDETWVEADSPQTLYEKIVGRTPHLPRRPATRPTAPPSWPAVGPDGRATPQMGTSLPTVHPSTFQQTAAHQWSPSPQMLGTSPRHVASSRRPLRSKLGRWRRLVDRCRRALGISNGGD